MAEIETIKKELVTLADLNFCSLEYGCKKFEEYFERKPEWLKVSINTIFVALEIQKGAGYNFIGKDLLYKCDKNLPDDAWRLESFDYTARKRYILYSPGA